MPGPGGSGRGCGNRWVFGEPGAWGSCGGDNLSLRVANSAGGAGRQPARSLASCPTTGGRAGDGVTQNPGGGGISGVGIGSFSASGCGDGGGFCDANRSITRAPPGRRRN